MTHKEHSLTPIKHLVTKWKVSLVQYTKAQPIYCGLGDLSNLWHSVYRSSCVIKHSALPHALKQLKPPPSAKNHAKHS